MRTRSRSTSTRLVALAASALTIGSFAVVSPAHATGEDDACATTPTPGRSTWNLTVDGVARTAVVYVPSTVGKHDDRRLLFALHGSNNTPAIMILLSLLEQSAEREGAIVVFPQGSVPAAPGTFAWNVPGVTVVPPGTPSDLDFLTTLTKAARERYCVDDDAVFATGYSGGGRMISAMACERAGVFRAIAPVVGLRAGVPVRDAAGVWGPDPATCSPKRGTPVVTFTGTADPVNPSEGGGAPYWQYSAKVAVERWAEINRCDDPDVDALPRAVTRTSYTDCPRGNDVVSYVIEGAGHVWPGGNGPVFATVTAILGAYTDAVDANATMWKFFADHD